MNLITNLNFSGLTNHDKTRALLCCGQALTSTDRVRLSSKNSQYMKNITISKLQRINTNYLHMKTSRRGLYISCTCSGIH